MSGLEIVFLIVAAMTLSAAFMVVTTQNLVHGALWLVLTLFGVAATFVLLNATFLAVVQVVVYIGAIAILLIFAIMLTRKVMQDSTSQTNANWIVAALLGLVLFVGIAQLLRKSSAVGMMMPAMDGFELCQELKKNPNTRDIPVIFVTARNDPKNETLALKMGAVDFIKKPVSPTTPCLYGIYLQTKLMK